MNRDTLVSVIIPTYKRADMLQRAVNSVLNQTYRNLEVLVVDDNNPDTEYRKKTENIMLQYKDNPRVIYIKQDKNKNGAAARNKGIKSSNGELIAFLDDDDYFYETKIEKQVNYLSNHSEFDAVYCGWDRDNKKVLPIKEGDLSFELLSGINLIYTNVIMMKKDAAVKCGGWDERFCRNQEAVFLLKYFKCGYIIGVISEILVEFDVSDRSNASNPKRNEEDFDLYLSVHEANILDCETKYKNAKDIIYSYRYRGVLLDYIKHREFRYALNVYAKMLKKIPFRFNRDLYIYCFRKITKKNLFKEFECN